MGTGASREKRQKQLVALSSRSHNAAIAEKIWDILSSLSDTLQTFQSKTGENCRTLRSIGERLELLLKDALEPGKPTSPLILETVQALKVLGDELLKKLEKVCCESPGDAQECSLQVAQFLERIEGTSKELVYKFNNDSWSATEDPQETAYAPVYRLLLQSFSKMSGEVVSLLRETIRAFQTKDPKLTCRTLSGLERQLRGLLASLEASLLLDKKEDKILVELRATTAVIKGIVSKSLQKLGEACCRSEGAQEDCRSAVLHLNEKLTELSSIIGFLHQETLTPREL
jgi:hypothetical protein